MTLRERLIGFWFKAVYYIFSRYEIFAWRVRYKVLPKFIRLLLVFLIACFISTIALLTYYGLQEQMSEKYQEVFSVVLSVAGTIVAIFFSLILIPLDKISERYSPKFLDYLKSDHVFITAFLYSVTLVVYNAYFLINGASNFIAYASSLQLVLLFVVILFLWRRSIFLSNPLNSVLIPEQDRIIGWTKKAIPRLTKRRIRQMNAISPNTREVANSTGYFRVDDSITDYVKSNLLPLREIALKAINNSEIEQSKNAMGSIAAIVLNYLYQRKDYHDDNDPLMYFIYTEFKLLANLSNKPELKIVLHPFIVDCWRNIAVQASKVNIKGAPRMTRSVNGLVIYPVKALTELHLLNIKEGDSTVPGDVAKALGDIGTTLMVNGYDHQASQTIEELAKLSLVADALNVHVFSTSANYHIMRVYTAGLLNRNKGSEDLYNYVYGEIDKAIRGLLEQQLKKKRDTFDNTLSPFIGQILDPMQGLNISRSIEYALFGIGLSEMSIKFNLKSVSWNIEYIDKALDALADEDTKYWGDQALENLYTSVLIMMSFLNDAMAKSHILIYKDEPVKNDEIKTEVTELMLKGIDMLIGVASKSDKLSMVWGRNPMDILTSLYLIVLYENKKQKHPELDYVFNEIHSKMVAFLNKHTNNGKTNNNSTTTKYFRLLQLILKLNRYYVKSKSFNVPAFKFSSSGFGMFDRELPSPLGGGGRSWILTRPTFQVNGYYYGDVETSLGLRSD